MCGRFTLATQQEILFKRFNLISSEVMLTPRYNISPSQQIAIVLNESPSTLSTAQWGLIPSWTKNIKDVPTLINARTETITEKPSFQKIFQTKRCLVLADGFYEWKKNSSKSKTPFYVRLSSKEVFAMAGLWDTWVSAEGNILRTCTIITTTANEVLSKLHHRMAVILNPEDEQVWLKENSVEKLKSLLKPYPAELFTTYEVSSKVNSVHNDDESLIEAAEATVFQASLF